MTRAIEKIYHDLDLRGNKIVNAILSDGSTVEAGVGATGGGAIVARRVGFVQSYTGMDYSDFGFIDDYDGRWVYLTLNNFRTIGGASSGAHVAGDWLQLLFLLIWNQYDNSRCPIMTNTGSLTNRGVSAEDDWYNNRRLTLPDFRGRAIIGSGSGFGLTPRAKSAIGGAEFHSLAESEMPAHKHTVRLSSDGETIANNFQLGTSGNTYTFDSDGTIGVPFNNGLAVNNDALSGSAGGSQAHNNMQPWMAENLLIASGTRNGVISTDGDPYFNYVTLLLNGEGADGDTVFTDESLSARTAQVTRAGNVISISTAQKKWGSSSIRFNGGGDYLSLPNPNFGLGNFGIEFWAYMDDNSQDSRLLIINGGGSGAQGGLTMAYQYGTLNVYDEYNGYGPGLSGIAAATWNFFQICRQDDTLYLRVNNIQSTRYYPIGNGISTYTGVTFGTNNFRGYLDSLRFTRLVSRRSIIPTAPFPTFQQA